jgi:dTDP-4-dehydrorhamnose reductase
VTHERPIVILGAAGQLGQEFVRRLPNAIAWDRQACDITNSSILRTRIETGCPSIVLNCTSYNRVDAAELEPTPAFAVNALAVRELARICRDIDCLLVHFSTNYVFGRERTRQTPYREEELPEPVNAYGVSKRLGEDFVIAECPRHLVIRTAALFGRATGSRHNFLENMRAKAESGQTVRIVADQVVAPTTTHDLAAATLHLVATEARGIYHVNGPDAATWFELAKTYLEQVGLVDRVVPVTTQELGAPAPRPTYSVLSIDHYAATGGPMPRSWHDAVEDYRRRRL